MENKENSVKKVPAWVVHFFLLMAMLTSTLNYGARFGTISFFVFDFLIEFNHGYWFYFIVFSGFYIIRTTFYLFINRNKFNDEMNKAIEKSKIEIK